MSERYAIWRCAPDGRVDGAIGCGWSDAVALHPPGPMVRRDGDVMDCPACGKPLRCRVVGPASAPSPDEGLRELEFDALVALPEAQERFEQAEAELARVREKCDRERHARKQIQKIKTDEVVSRRTNLEARITSLEAELARVTANHDAQVRRKRDVQARYEALREAAKELVAVLPNYYGLAVYAKGEERVFNEAENRVAVAAYRRLRAAVEGEQSE